MPWPVSWQVDGLHGQRACEGVHSRSCLFLTRALRLVKARHESDLLENLHPRPSIDVISLKLTD